MPTEKDPELVAAVAELCATAVRLNRPGFTVFVRYSGHVDELEVDIHPAGWRRSDHSARSVYFSGWREPATPRDVRALAGWLRSLSDRAGMAQCPRCSAAPAPPAPTPPAPHRPSLDRIQEVFSASDAAVTTTDVARRAGVDRQYACTLLRRLEAAGEVERAGPRAWRKPGAEATR